MTSTTTRPRVFLLYHPDDVELASHLATVLRTKGAIDVWFDEWEINVGDARLRKIEDAIEQSDGGLVLLSERGFDDELDRGVYAALIQRTLDRGKYVIPIRHGADAKIPALLEDRRFVDAAHEEGICRAILIRHNLVGSEKPPLDGPTEELTWELPPEIERLRQVQRKLILYAGPAVSVAAGLRSRRGLAELLVKALPSYVPEPRRALVRELCSSGNLPDAFTELERDLGEQKFGGHVEHALGMGKKAPVPQLAWAIARLAPKLQGVITPNLDDVLYRAFRAKLSTHHAVTPGLANSEGWMLQIHGAVEDRRSWVLTRRQCDQALLDPVRAQVFQTLFFGGTILFVGTPVDDPITSALIDRVRVMSHGGRAPSHFALVPEAEANPVTRMKLEEAGISVIPHADESELLDILELLEHG